MRAMVLTQQKRVEELPLTLQQIDAPRAGASEVSGSAVASRRHTIADCGTGVRMGICCGGFTDESDHRSVRAESLPGRTRKGDTGVSYRLR